jgi:hypothetical protein
MTTALWGLRSTVQHMTTCLILARTCVCRCLQAASPRQHAYSAVAHAPGLLPVSLMHPCKSSSIVAIMQAGTPDPGHVRCHAPFAQHTSTASGFKCSTQRFAVPAMCADGTASSSSVEAATMPPRSVVATSSSGQLWPGNLLLLVCCVLISSATCLQATGNSPAAEEVRPGRTEQRSSR